MLPHFLQFLQIVRLEHGALGLGKIGEAKVPIRVHGGI